MSNIEKQERKELAKKFGKHLIELRSRKKITAAELSRRSYIEKPNISRIEKGNINPSLYILNKLATALEISLEELFRGFN